MARMRISLVAATATIAAFAAPTTALAATTDCDGLQAALDNNANTVVTLNEGAVCHGHFDLPERAITFEGAGSGATLDGDGKSQILSGFNVGTTTIRNLTFVDGAAFEDDGGAIQVRGGNSVPTIEDSKFFSNEATDGGAGGAVSLDLVTDVVDNAVRGVAGPIVLRGNTFQDNSADDEGGAVSVEAFFRSVTVEDNTFADNVSDDEQGGGLNLDEAGNVTLTGNTFTGNEAGDDGGGASVEACRADVTGNVFSLNRIGGSSSSLDGGGLFLTGSACFATLTRGDAVPSFQTDNRFRGNVISGASFEGLTNGRGGGESIENLDVVSTNDRYVGNTIEDTTTGTGGGLSYDSFIGTLVARNLVATGNEISTTPPQEVPERGLFFGESRGGGVFLAGNNQNTRFEIADATIEGNTALAGSGIAQELQRAGLTRGEGSSGDTLLLENSIVFGNTGADDSDKDAFDGEIDGFIEARELRSSDVCVDGAPHDGAGNICTDPKLKAPAGDENVDQTAASPTIDAGDSSLVHGDLSKDYAGDGRKLGARVDMGADEYKPATVEPTPTPTPTPTVQPAAPAPPQGAVQGQTQKSCASKRSFRIRIRVPKGKKARSATVRVNNKKVKVVRGKRLRAPVRLRGLPKGKFTVKITVRLTNGKRITGKRTYHTCIPGLPGDGPPRV